MGLEILARMPSVSYKATHSEQPLILWEALISRSHKTATRKIGDERARSDESSNELAIIAGSNTVPIMAKRCHS